ncbi:MAG: 4Fe-4S binding protein, partial [Victivallales bacterium]|nr:4Fe-4S binding protein [Victivallales bacterium]
DKKVDAITGATFSSNGVIDSMKARMAALGDIKPTPAVHNWRLIVSNVCFVLLLAVSLVGFFRPRLLGKGRMALLGASIIILAFWQGRMLSMAQFSVWLLNGIPLAAQWTVALLFLLSIVLPIIFGKAYYCAWVCPFGAAQELLGMMNRKRKIRLGNAVLQWLQLIRTAVLFGILLVMGMGLSFGFEDFEAFTVFHPSTAPKLALALGAVSLFASLWLPRPWCRFLCPLGELLETFRRQKSENKA